MVRHHWGWPNWENIFFFYDLVLSVARYCVVFNENIFSFKLNIEKGKLWGHNFFLQVSCPVQSLKADLIISKLNSVGLTSLNNIFIESSHTWMWNFTMCAWIHRHKYCTSRNTSETVKATMDLWSGVDRSNIHQAELKPPCCHFVIGLELVWHCCQLQENPRCFLLPGPGGLWQFTRVQNCPKTLSVGYGVEGNPIHF